MVTDINLYKCDRVPIDFCLEGLCDLCVACALGKESAPSQVIVEQIPELARKSESSPLLLLAD